ncbi:MAG: hypothetical protein QUV05_06975 [Phycisphaerae bacterium]|jgi:hypothetical protein|nr:hypothetical protein [Phycisphaerae bacterium]
MAKKKAMVKRKKVRPVKKSPTKSGPKKRKGIARTAKVTGSKRSSWLDANSHKPLIDQYARQLTSFMEAIADGRIETPELAAQEARLTRLMKEIEPQLSDALHEKITRLLCELTAYDLMQMLHSMQENRPQTTFHG